MVGIKVEGITTINKYNNILQQKSQRLKVLEGVGNLISFLALA